MGRRVILAIFILVGSIVLVTTVGWLAEKRRCRLCSGQKFLTEDLACPLCNDEVCNV